MLGRIEHPMSASIHPAFAARPQRLSATTRFLGIVCWIPLLTFIAVIGFATVAAIQVGQWPHYANPDPKDLHLPLLHWAALVAYPLALVSIPWSARCASRFIAAARRGRVHGWRRRLGVHLSDPGKAIRMADRLTLGTNHALEPANAAVICRAFDLAAHLRSHPDCFSQALPLGCFIWVVQLFLVGTERKKPHGRTFCRLSGRWAYRVRGLRAPKRPLRPVE
jgi:hypothetical protein